MKYHQIGIGTKMELELYNDKGEKISTGLVSQFESFDEENNMMVIHVPFTQGKIYAVQPGTKANIIFSKDNDIFMFMAEVVDRKKIEPIPMLWVKPLSEIEKVERRSFFRMECKLTIQYHTVDSTDTNGERKLITCHTKDISGGGVCVITGTAHTPGTKIQAYLKLDRMISFVGTIVRVVEIKEKGSIKYELGIEYKHIENKDREKIISYIFETQRERIRKGWIKV